MRKILVLASALALLAGGASAQTLNHYNAADSFAPSEQNDIPDDSAFLRGAGIGDSALVTGSVDTGVVTSGVVAKRYFGYNASDDFGPSERNDAPGDVGPGALADHTATGSVATGTVYRGYNASSAFEASY